MRCQDVKTDPGANELSGQGQQSVCLDSSRILLRTCATETAWLLVLALPAGGTWTGVHQSVRSRPVIYHVDGLLGERRSSVGPSSGKRC